MNKYLIGCLIIVVPILVAFTKYEGDGKLINHGVFDANRRYTLTLGDIDLSSNGTYNFRSSNLPTEEFVFGLEIQSNEILKEPLPINSKLEMSISTADNVIIHKVGKLKEWTWSISSGNNKMFVYGRDNQPTYFKAVKNKKYNIEILVSEADRSASKYTVRLVGRVGGWK